MANESSGKKALKAGLGYTVGNMLVKGLSFLAIPLFARLMTVEDFGIYSTFSSYVMIMTVLAGFTLHTSVRNAKLDYDERTGSYCSSVTLLVIGNSLLLLALSLVFAAPLARATTEGGESVVKKYVAMYEPEQLVQRAWRDARRGRDVSQFGFVARFQTALTKLLPHSLVMDVWMRQQKLQ